jgi:opacity protein-like surface antigen
MKRITRLVGIAMVTALPALAQAQDATTRPLSFGVSGGASIPMSDLGDVAETGFNLGAHLMYKPASLARVAFRGDVTYDRWAFKGAGAQSVDATSSALGVTANVIFKSASAMTIKPYVIGGVGLISSKVSGDLGPITYDSDSRSNLGIQGGGGLEFQLSGFTTFLEAKFVNSFTENKSTNWVPVTFGIRF